MNRRVGLFRPLAAGLGLGLALCALAAAPPETMRSTLKSIVLPDLVFRETPVTEIVEFVSEKSREVDPEGVGVSILLKLKPGVPVKKLTLTIHHPTVERALELIASAADLNMRIDRSAVVLEPVEPPATPPAGAK